VQAQDDYCSYAEALARTLLSQYTDSCSADLSACNVPVCSDCLDGVDSATTGCVDGCSYTSGDYTVERSFTGSYGIGYIDYLAVPIVLVGTAHTFTAGAEGYFFHNYEAVVNDDYTTLSAALGGSCQFNFNDNDCPCEQRYCDDSETDYGFFVDCSEFEGGSVIDFCVATGASSPLLEILFGVPFVACRAPSDTEPFPTTSPGSGSSVAATFVPTILSSMATAIAPTSSPAKSDSAVVPAEPVVAPTTEPAVTGTAATPPPLTVEGTMEPVAGVAATSTPLTVEGTNDVAPPPPAPVAPKPETTLSSASVQTAQATCPFATLFVLSIVLSQMML
jgi:hypothetical protein